MGIEMNAVDLIKRHEGLRLKPYTDTVGKVTIGYGRNLTDSGISAAEADDLLTNDINAALANCRKYVWFSALSATRQAAVVDFMFNVGPKTFGTFRHFIEACDAGDYAAAAAALRNSLWWKEVGMRGPELVNLLEHEVWPV